MRKLKITIILVCCLIAARTVAQQLQKPPQIIAPSPEAAALGKYGDWPVSLYTGIPNISLPFYTVAFRELQLPVQLSYHASGIKVEDVASWVGTGWALEAGGLITRAVVGLPDDVGNGYLFKRKAIESFPQVFDVRQNDQYKLLTDIADGRYDTEPDQYYFNFAGVSGKFYIDNNGEMKSMPLSKIRVVRFPVFNSSPGTPNYWEIVDEKGITYILGQDNCVETSRFMDEDQMVSSSAISGWYLNKIIAPNKQDSIVFTYENKSEFYTVKNTQQLRVPETIQFSPFITHDILVANGYGYSKYLGDGPQAATNSISGKTRLRAITWKYGRIDFYANTPRKDIAGSAVLLDSIVVSNTQGVVVSKYELAYDNNTVRPFLSQITQHPADKIKQDYYTFQYHSGLPDRFSNQQDSWGYYNGKNNSSLIPNDPAFYNFNTSLFPAPDADRSASEFYMKAGTLRKITYPTGGSTVFDYETNRYYKVAEPGKEIPGHYENSGFGSGVVQGVGAANWEANLDNTNTRSKPSKLRITAGNYYRGMDTDNSHLPRFQIFKVNPDGTTTLFFSWNAYDDKMKGSYTYNSSTMTEDLVFNTELILPAGPLKFIAEVVCLRRGCPVFPLKTRMDFSIDFERYYPPYTPPAPTANYALGGGLRIMSLTNTDAQGNVQGIKKYEYGQTVLIDNKPQEVSSGVLITMPKYFSASRRPFVCSGADPNGIMACNETMVMTGTFTSSPVAVLGVTQGGYVGYERVTEKEGPDGKNGKIEYVYSNTQDVINTPNVHSIYSRYGHWPVFVPNIDKSYARGLLLEKNVFAYAPEGYKLVMQEKNTYDLNDGSNGENLVSTRYLKVRRMADSLTTCCGFGPAQNARDAQRLYEFGYSYYQVIAPWVRLASKTTMIDGVSQTTNYSYNSSNMQRAGEETVNSKGEKITTTYKYPHDRVRTGEDPTAVYQKMIDRNMIMPVVGQEIYNNNQLKHATAITFRDWFSNGQLLAPETITESINNGPAYPVRIFTAYDKTGNILSFSNGNNFPSSFKWAYDGMYPVMKADNAAFNEIYYEGFEHTTVAGVLKDIARQGQQSFKGSYTVDFKRPDNKKYYLAYWEYTGGKWEYRSQLLTQDYPVLFFSNPVDELVVCPEGALFSTYSYLPLIGVTSESTGNTLFRKYEYDELGRLKIVRDADGKILKMMEYKYLSQQ